VRRLIPQLPGERLSDTTSPCSFVVNRGIGKKLATGENSNTPSWNSPVSTHAEIAALNRLQSHQYFRAKNKRNRKVEYDLLVIRLGKSGKLGSSRPCYHCLNTMEKSNIKIRYVYYSTEDGTIKREKFTQMKISPLTYISNGRKHRHTINKT
jgi:hypothetical protein